MSNHLIIGLGGTGGKIIQAFRRTVYDEYRSKDPVIRRTEENGTVSERPHPVKLGYLYVDSNPELMEPNHPSWKVLGDSLQLGKNSQLLINRANLVGVLENLGAHPNISPWIGDRAEWRDILDSVGEEQGGQKRRLGRFLFACKAKDSTNGFLNRLKDQVHALRQKSGDTAITFHVCAGLAGGTGSGSLVDVITQIRKLFPEEENRVVLYFLLPEAQPPSDWDTGNYHANGYGALMELNSLSVQAFHPHDVADAGQRVRFRDATGNPVSPFSGAYLFTTENESGRVLHQNKDPQKDEPSKMMGSFLFQKIVAASATPWADELRRMENAENGDGSPESVSGTNVPQRSKRFLGFGIKRLIIPEEEIREFISYNFARQAIYQLQFNNWSSTQGYLDVPLNEAFAQYVADSRNQERWRMSDSYLNMERGILHAEEIENWRGIEDDWKASINGFLQVAMKSDDAVWMPKLAQLAENHFSANWRGKGVLTFFRMKEGDIKDQAKEIRQRLEADLWEQWVTGNWSMSDIGRLLGELRKFLVEKADGCNRQITKFRAMVEDGKAPAPLAVKIRENSVTWAKVGFLSAAFGKRKNLIQAQAECYKEYYSAKHRVESWSFAAKLLQQVLLEIDDFIDTVQDNISSMSEIVKGDTNSTSENRFAGLAERIESRCQESHVQDLKEQVVKLYEPAAVRQFTKKLLRDEEIQRAQTKVVRDAIVETLGERAGFATFRLKMTRGRLMDILEEVCDSQAEKAHNNLVVSEPGLQRMMGANIVDILAGKFSGNPLQLKDFARELAGSAGTYLRFDPMEEKRTGPGASEPSMKSSLAILLPKGSDHPEFRAELEDAFSLAFASPPSFYENPKSTEITLITIRNLFPLRYVKQTSLLRDKYVERLTRMPRARMEVHCEGPSDSWPPIFLPDGDEIRRKMYAWLLLAKAMKMTRELEDPENGIKALYLVEKDERGREKPPIHLAANDAELAEAGDPAVAFRIQNAVQAALEGEFLHTAKRKELAEKLDEGLVMMQRTLPNPLDKRRSTYETAVASAESYLEQR